MAVQRPGLRALIRRTSPGMVLIGTMVICAGIIFTVAVGGLAIIWAFDL